MEGDPWRRAAGGQPPLDVAPDQHVGLQSGMADLDEHRQAQDAGEVGDVDADTDYDF